MNPHPDGWPTASAAPRDCQLGDGLDKGALKLSFAKVDSVHGHLNTSTDETGLPRARWQKNRITHTRQAVSALRTPCQGGHQHRQTEPDFCVLGNSLPHLPRSAKPLYPSYPWGEGGEWSATFSNNCVVHYNGQAQRTWQTSACSRSQLQKADNGMAATRREQGL
jgi:hypothetical protein